MSRSSTLTSTSRWLPLSQFFFFVLAYHVINNKSSSRNSEVKLAQSENNFFSNSFQRLLFLRQQGTMGIGYNIKVSAKLVLTSSFAKRKPRLSNQLFNLVSWIYQQTLRWNIEKRYKGRVIGFVVECLDPPTHTHTHTHTHNGLVCGLFNVVLALDSSVCLSDNKTTEFVYISTCTVFLSGIKYLLTYMCVDPIVLWIVKLFTTL